MKYLALLLILFAQIAFETPYADVIAREWKIAQDYLYVADDIGEEAYTVEYSDYVWEPVKGSFPGETNYYKGVLNGLAYEIGYADGVTKIHIKWNTEKDYIIRHEAAHVILYEIGHPCVAAFDLDNTKVKYHKFVPSNKFCEEWIKDNWGDMK
jgi:hypothetical protein